ncbi:sphingomyelin phosphodiesterase [Nocardiopsis composta]|uniref:Sphingomyelin phosphodiesterase n=1 Tax=Nocardiopsis composta TaxID=157465 RepID=A0A7W8QN95_9ACTN|nr:sphingomyelin phosphodiesterase [Nocardiopsis composta]MBB5432918.1 sphingomyelin phosphodiesterase [Nocardiopsis composta]
MRKRIPLMFAALLGAASVAAAPPATADGAPAIATYNAFIMSKNLYPNWGQDLRADMIAEDGLLSGQDVVVLQEAFDNSASERLIGNLSAEYPHATPVVGRSSSGWDATTGYRGGTSEDGGVAVLSRWPIVRAEQHIFADACGGDWFSGKGFAYVELDTPAGPLHVVGTHLQSADDGCAGDLDVHVRWSQLDRIAAVLAEKEIPGDEPVYVAGDFNVIGGSDEYDSMIEQLGAVRPEYTGAPYSFDPDTNSIAGERYPGAAGEALDHVLPIANGAAPASYTNETREVHSEPWTVTSWGKEYTYTDHSDHYPVFGGGAG